MIEINTRNRCRHCDRPIIWRRPVNNDGVALDWAGPYWFHDDERPEYAEGEDSRSYGSNKLNCMGERFHGARAEPENICMYNTGDYETCGRRIPPDNLREEIYACGIHARKERERIAHAESVKLRQEKDVSDTDLREWARQQIGVKVAEIIEAGLPVKWDNGIDERYGTRRDRGDPKMVVTVAIEDLLEYVRAHHS